MPLYVLIDETGTESDPFEAADEYEAVQEAKERVGEWVDPDILEKTQWVKEVLAAVEGDKRRDIGDMWRRIDPTLATKCPDGNFHEWVDSETLYRLVGGLRENPGVFGSGGGVVIVEVCRKCGTKVARDTWCDCDGSGPHECIRVKRAKYADELGVSVR